MADCWSKHVFPIVRRKFPPLRGEPLRRNIDYQSVGRKVFLVDELPSRVCDVCKKHTVEGAEAGCEVCIVAQVLE